MRSSVDLPQPEGPRMVTKSFSRTSKSIGSSACVRLAACVPVKVRGRRRGSESCVHHERAPGEEAAVERLEREVGDQADHADDDDPEDDLAGVQQRLAVGDHVADARGRADQLGHDHVGPGPAQHQAQRLGDARRGARDQHARDDAAAVGAQRVGGLDQVAPRAADGDRHHQHDLEERADEDHQQLLRLADAGPQDQQRNEGRGRQVAAEGDEGLEEGLDRLLGAHRDAQRHGDDGGQHEAAEHAPHRHADVVDEAVLGEEQPRLPCTIVTGLARKVGDTKPPSVKNAQTHDEEHEEADAQQPARTRADGLERRQRAAPARRRLDGGRSGGQPPAWKSS